MRVCTGTAACSKQGPKQATWPALAEGTCSDEASVNRHGLDWYTSFQPLIQGTLHAGGKLPWIAPLQQGSQTQCKCYESRSANAHKKGRNAGGSSRGRVLSWMSMHSAVQSASIVGMGKLTLAHWPSLRKLKHCRATHAKHPPWPLQPYRKGCPAAAVPRHRSSSPACTCVTATAACVATGRHWHHAAPASCPTRADDFATPKTRQQKV